MTFRSFALGLLLLSATIPSSVAAQEKTGAKEGFVLKPGTVRIVLMRPSISVASQSTGGMREPNADWTNQAITNLNTALREVQTKLGNEIIPFDEEIATGDTTLMDQYGKLFGAVADSVIEYQFFAGNRLPTKKRGKTFEWGVGPGLAKVQALQNADYALFINTRDDYGSTGRKMLQIVGMFAGVGISSGVHMGSAGLIDLKTGELVWLNADRQMGGDVRTAEGAAKRVRQLLEGFPGKPTEATDVKQAGAK